VVGGGEYHADCEEVLLGDGSRQEDIRGADWYPQNQRVDFGALINIRPHQGNRGIYIENPKLSERIKMIIKILLAGR
jgi:hypothetical protein